MRLSFDLPNKNTSERIYSIVRARFRHNQKRYQFKTEISVPIALWIQKEQRLSESREAIAKAGLNLKQIRAYNEHLEAVRDKFTETVRKQRLAAYPLDLDPQKVIVEMEQTEQRSSADLVFAMHDFIQDAASANMDTTRFNEPLQPRTIAKYKDCARKLEAFAEATNTTMELVRIDLDWYNAFVGWMQSQEYKASTIAKHVACIKAVLAHEETDGTRVHPAYKTKAFRKPKKRERMLKATISVDELKHLMAMDLKGRLERTRDLLVIGCWTALRVSDLMKLGDVKVHKDDEGEFIQVESTKIAGTFIEVPLHKHVQQIRQRWGGWPPLMSEQRFNHYAKELCKLAGMDEPMQGEVAKVIEMDGKAVKRNIAGTYAKWELISSHTCRRSFATNCYGIIRTGDIMHVTGHASERQLMDYIHAKPIDTRRRVRAAMAQM